MTGHAMKPLSPRIETAIAELEKLISDRYPEATYEILNGTDPNGVWLLAEVDVEDLLDVSDVIAERELELQVDEGLALYVFPTRPVKGLDSDRLQRPSPLQRPAIGR